ncbi:MAG: hypothetical protein JOZ18_10435 [Chloroflexi bacterium]|nr:hypothetical protein [Chloroflexota bacterium]
MSSEVARFREQYELEYQAAKRGLEGVAIVASHQFITKRMENMWEQFQHLVHEVGQAEAHRMIFGESLEQQEEQNPTSQQVQGKDASSPDIAKEEQ